MTDWPYGTPFKFGEHDPNWVSTLLQAYEERRVPWEKSMETRTLILERFLEMLDERGLSSHQYDETLTNYRVDHMIDVGKDGEWLARYNTAFLHRFSEGDMAQELDKLKGQVMRRNSIECDSCSSDHSVDDEYDVTHLPASWFTVVPGQGGGFKETVHFCSAKCLKDWAEKQTIVLNESFGGGAIPVAIRMDIDVVRDNPSHMKRGEFKVTKEDCDRWRDL